MIHPKPGTVRGIRQGIQILALLLFIALFITAAYKSPVIGFADLFYRLDPLAALAAWLAGRALTAGLALAGITVVLTLIFGRVWCGWLCPMGTTLDLLHPRERKSARKLSAASRVPPEKLRVIKYLLLVFLLAAAALGNLTLMFLDPITIMTRTMTMAVWPALRSAVIGVEALLYQFEALWGPLDALHQAIISPLFGEAQPVSSLAVPVLLFFLSIVLLNQVAERFWCRYLCPLGGLFGLLSRISLFRRVTGGRCTQCGVCARSCPTGAIQPENNYASDPAECTVCWDCVADCSRGGTDFRWNFKDWKPAARQAYDPGRRETLAAIGGAAVTAALAGVAPERKQTPAMLVRPPGSDQASFETACIRCGECVRVCPTQGLQPSFLENGWQNLLTPRLIPRLGACSFQCNACGEVCPTGAIPPFTLDIKRLTPIGLARVDRSRCLPWAYTIDCIVCEEACPVANKAIHLDLQETKNGRGETVTIQRPYVIKELCTGCGMCEYQCPMGGDAAIRVFAPTTAGGFFGDDTAFGQPDNGN